MTFGFHCTACGQVHEGIPTFGATAPLAYYSVPEAQRSELCKLDSDTCIVDDEFFFIRGCIEIPVHGQSEPLVWGQWVLLNEKDFKEWLGARDQPKRSHLGPYPGLLDIAVRAYPEAMDFKTRVHLRDNGVRPYIELEPTNHPMALEQREGITTERVAEIYRIMIHGSAA